MEIMIGNDVYEKCTYVGETAKGVDVYAWGEPDTEEAEYIATLNGFSAFIDGAGSVEDAIGGADEAVAQCPDEEDEDK